MSFVDQPGLTTLQKIGCATYCVVCAAVISQLAIVAALGDCASDSCLSDSIRLLMFPGSLILAIVVGFGILKIFAREKH